MRVLVEALALDCIDRGNNPMAKRGGSGRKYIRDAIGRFAGKGYSGQTSGRGARLKAKGKKRAEGGARTTKGTGKPKGTISKTKFGRDDDRTNRQLDRDIAAAKGRVAARKKKTK